MARPSLKLKHERKLKRCGHGTIAGIDEVGRGPLAGPVVAAAVVLDLDNVPKDLADSKVLTCEERETLFEAIVATSEIGVASIAHHEIDAINIRQATLRAMCRALAALPCTPDIALVDGNDRPALPCAVEMIVKGDAIVPSIAAASIVAKVVRDRMMRRLGTVFPVYGFETNVGYRSPLHLSVLASHGPCPFHRLTFAPLRKAAD
jgi:ribonuclease HII